MSFSHCGKLVVLAAFVVAVTAVIKEQSFATITFAEERTLGSQSDPQSVPKKIRVNAFGENHDLKLVPNAPIFSPALAEGIINTDSNGNVYVEKANTTREDREALEEHFFTDETGHSSLHAEMINGNLHLEGILKDGIRIQPTKPATDEGKPVHVAFKHGPQDGSFRNCLSVTPNYTVPINSDNMVETRALPAIVQPELMLLIDYQVSSYFRFDFQLIKKYLGIFFNSVNRRYATIPTPNIQILISGIYLTPSPGVQTFAQNVAPNTVDPTATLGSFGIWLYSNQDAINQPFDLAFWFTGMLLGDGADSSEDGTTEGISYVGGVCTNNGQQYLNVGIGRDNPGQFTGVETFAHEIGHVLGAAHDQHIVNNPPGNPGALSCPWADGFIMSYIFGTLNKFYFSTCSVAEFTFTIQNPQASCLQSTATPENLVTFQNILPGTFITLDKQCATAFGQGVFFYTPKSSSVCVERWCAKPISNGYQLLSDGPALEGSPCGGGGGNMCIRGVCTTSGK